MRCLPSAAECQVHIGFAERFAQIAVGRRDAALPARLLFFRAGQIFAVESEVFILEFRRQNGGLAVDEMEGEIGLPVGHGHGFQERFLAFEKIRHRDVEALHGRGLKRGEVKAPVERVGESASNSASFILW